MASVNDEKFRALGVQGYTQGDISGRWRAFLIANTPAPFDEARSTVDLEMGYLDGQLEPMAARNDRWFNWLGRSPRNHTGSLNDRWLAYWQSIT